MNSDYKNIPGMIEEAEQTLLYKSIIDLNLSNESTVVEIGSFFGKSTNCIIEGLIKNKTNKYNKFYVYDSFSADKNGIFAKYIQIYAKKSKTEKLLCENISTINFRKVFDFFTENKYKNLIVNEVSIKKSVYIDKKKIAFLFIDAPKFYEEFIQVLEKFFKFVEINGTIIFQDCFYHWSATLIATIEILFNEGYIEFQSTAASSLKVKLINNINENDVEKIKKIYNSSDISKLILNLYDRFKSLKIDRKSYFLNRFLLANVQILFSQGKITEAKNFSNQIFLSLLENNDKNAANLLKCDLAELLKNDFNLRKLYEIDYL